MPTPADSDEIEEAGLRAVAELIAEIEPGAMVAKFVLIVEVIQPDGEWAVWTITSPDQRSWDTLGLLTHAVQDQQNGGDDDD